jgi:hypothetical protein
MRAFIVLASLTVVSCTTGVIRPDARDAHWASQQWPGTTVDDLSRGRDLFVLRCAGCHNLPQPVAKTPEEWAGVVEEMGPGAKLGPAERELVLRYLSAASERLHHPNE